MLYSNCGSSRTCAAFTVGQGSGPVTTFFNTSSWNMFLCNPSFFYQNSTLAQHFYHDTNSKSIPCTLSPEPSAPCAQASSAAHSLPPKRTEQHGHPSPRHHVSPRRSKRSSRGFKNNLPALSALHDRALPLPTQRHQPGTLWPTRTATLSSLRARKLQLTCSHN